MKIKENALKMADLASKLEISLALEAAYPSCKGKDKTLKFASQSPHSARKNFTMTLDGVRYPATSIPDIVWEDFKQIQKIGTKTS